MHTAAMLALLLAACVPASPSVGGTGAHHRDPALDTGDSGDSGDPGDSAEDPDWAAFVDERDANLAALGEPILACVARVDNSHAVFNGCYDWHSAVHGHWALFTLSRLLEDPTWAEAAELKFNDAELATELAQIEANRLGEVPYGYAWFLLLALEREAMGEEDLRPHALAAASALDAHIAGLTPGQARGAALADDYPNLTWAVINLWRWAQAEGDVEQATRMESAARDLLLPLDDACPLSEDLTDTDNFFPACLLRAHALLTVLPPDEAAAWLEGALPADYPITPVTNITSAHTSGLNFSRSWGLWSLHAATGDPAWRSRLVEHVEWQMNHPEYWAEDYLSYSHWVPQFGVYALAQTAE